MYRTNLNRALRFSEDTEQGEHQSEEYEEDGMNGLDYDLIGGRLPKERFLGILVPAMSIAPISVTAESEAETIEAVLGECRAQLRIMEGDSGVNGCFPADVDEVFANFWREFTFIVMGHPECHPLLIRFLRKFLETVQVIGRDWFKPQERLGKELFRKHMSFWHDEVHNDAEAVLNAAPPEEDTTLHHPSIVRFINYFQFQACIIRDSEDLPGLQDWPSIVSLPHEALDGVSAENRKCRDASLLAWIRVLEIIGVKAFVEFREEWPIWEQEARNIANGLGGRRRDAVVSAASALSSLMSSIRESVSAGYPQYQLEYR